MLTLYMKNQANGTLSAYFSVFIGVVYFVAVVFCALEENNVIAFGWRWGGLEMNRKHVG